MGCLPPVSTWCRILLRQVFCVFVAFLPAATWCQPEVARLRALARCQSIYSMWGYMNLLVICQWIYDDDYTNHDLWNMWLYKPFSWFECIFLHGDEIYVNQTFSGNVMFWANKISGYSGDIMGPTSPESSPDLRDTLLIWKSLGSHNDLSDSLQ